MAVTMRESKRHPQNQVAALLTACLFAFAVIQPGVLLGAAITLAWWRWLPTSLFGRIAVGVTATALFAISLPTVVWAWPWRLLVGIEPSRFVPPAWALHNPAPVIGLSLLAETFAGPAWATGVLLIRWTHEGMPSGMIEKERKQLEARRRRVKHLQPSDEPQEPSGVLRLGVEGRSGDVDIQLPMDFAQHVTVLGKMGSGKTTTAARLMEAAAIAGWPVVVIDAKGFGSLRTVSARFAERFDATFRVVAPDDPGSLRYNPCEGTPSQISNKLIGAFAFGESAEIYKQIAQEIIPVLIRAIRASGKPVTLASVARALSPQGMVGLSRSIPPDDDDLAEYLADLSDRKAPYTAGYAGMRSRLGALLQGMYGQVLTPTADPPLDLDTAFTGNSITYISLPALEGSEDVELMARVLAQDIKQVAAHRIARGETGYALLILDEFAALREAEQLTDLLLQAREARICCVISTQFLPNANDALPLRHALQSAGLFISHQCSAEDSETVASVYGTRKTVEVTNQVDYQTGTSEKGSMRHVDEYRVNPNELRDLPRGTAAVRIEPRDRRIALVRIDRPKEMEGRTPT
jgi:hypothetical protein